MIKGLKSASWAGDNRDAIVTFINSNLPESLADKIEAINNINGQLEFDDLDGNKLIEINNPTNNKYSAVIKNSMGTIKTITQAESYTSNTRTITVLICSNGVIIDFVIDNSHFYEFYTVDMNGNLVYGCSAEFKAGGNFVGFYSTAYDSADLKTNAGCAELNITNLVNIAYPNEFNVRSYCPDAYFALYSQYPDVDGIITMEESEFISCGMFMIKDSN